VQMRCTKLWMFTRSTCVQVGLIVTALASSLCGVPAHLLLHAAQLLRLQLQPDTS
jgi:hypothetical protein